MVIVIVLGGGDGWFSAAVTNGSRLSRLVYLGCGDCCIQKLVIAYVQAIVIVISKMLCLLFCEVVVIVISRRR